MPFQINANTHSDARQFFERYNVWATAKQKPTVEFVAGGIPCYRYTDVNHIRAEDHAVVIVDSLKEGMHNLDLFNKVLPKGSDYIVLSCSELLPNILVEFPGHIVCYSKFLFDMVALYANPNSVYHYSNYAYTWDDNKPFVWSSVYSTPRNHRIQFAESLDTLGYDNFVFRLAGKDLGVSANGYDTVEVDNDDDAQSIVKKLSNVAGNIDQAQWYYWRHLPHKLMNACRFSLILDTDFDTGCLCLNEKIFKPLLMGMPFVLAGPCGILKFLHSHGFQSFGDLWDESYDCIDNNGQRLQAVVDLVRQLGKFDWSANQSRLQQICQYNRSKLWDLNQVEHRQFLNFFSIIQRYEC